MELELKSIEPETATEAALKAYAEFLERQIIKERRSKGKPSFFKPERLSIETTTKDFDRQWHDGLCRVDLHQDLAGMEIELRTKGLAGGKHWAMGIFVDRSLADMPMNVIGNRLSYLYKEGLVRCAEMLTGRDNPEFRARMPK